MIKELVSPGYMNPLSISVQISRAPPGQLRGVQDASMDEKKEYSY